MVDIRTLEHLAERMKQDAKSGMGLNVNAVLSIASIIEDSIGAPIGWPSRKAGCDAADDCYPGSPDLRLAFNTGVKWAVEHHEPTTLIKERRW